MAFAIPASCVKGKFTANTNMPTSFPGKQRGGQVAVTGVGQQHHDGLAGVLGPLGQFQGGMQC